MTALPVLLRRRESDDTPEHRAGRSNLLQLVQLRWIAVAGQLVTILVAVTGMGARLPLTEMLALLAALSLFNLASGWRLRSAQRIIGHHELFFGLVVDVLVLSGLLHLSGGITNPFIFLFLLQVVVAAVLLPARHTWTLVALTCLSVLVLTNWYRPLDPPELSGSSFSLPYVAGLLICFALDAALLVIFIGRIGRNLRLRDAHVAALRQRAAEEEHIVRMGLLASGAAHELGTPLATLSVILGDWLRMPAFAKDTQLRSEIGEMQAQLQRCKSIVGGILLSAGEARGDAPQAVGLRQFFDELVAQWRSIRPGQPLLYDRSGLNDGRIVSDTALRQMLGNLVDNAAEAAPDQPLRLRVVSDVDWLTVSVRDQGPGFAQETLDRLGQPYNSSKRRPGSGLGLFLSVNVARTLGGRIEAFNPPGGGAEVVVTLPMAALAIDEGDAGGAARS